MIYKGIYRQQKLTNTIKIRLKIKKYDGEGMTDNLEKLEKYGLRKIIKKKDKRNNKEYVSYIIYLPKEWIDLAKIKDKDKLEIEGNEEMLILKVVRTRA